MVVGTTGAFLIAACDLGGYLEAGGGGVTIGGRRLRGFASVRRGARKLRGRLSAANVFAEVTPIVCLTRAVAGAPRTVRGVRVVAIAHLASDVTNGPRVLLPNHCEQAARSIGSLAE